MIIMTDRYLYPSLFTFEDDHILVSFPDFPGCLTYGKRSL